MTLVGLGLGVALVVAIASLSNGPRPRAAQDARPARRHRHRPDRHAQPPQQQTRAAGSAAAAAAAAAAANRDLIQANQSVITDLSKLGKPGTHFVHDFFLPGTQLTFQQSAAKQIATLAGVAQVTTGLTLLAEHQEGVVPKIVATLKTQAKTFHDPAQPAAPDAPPTSRRCRPASQKPGVDARRRQTAAAAAAAAAAASAAAAAAAAAAVGGANRAAFQKCLPASLQRFRTRFTAPSQTLKQVLNPPQTNIKTTAYTIGGVDPTHPTMGVVTTAQVTKGRFLAPAGGKRGARRDELRREALAEGRLEARPERHVVHGRRARQPAARRPERRRLPAAEAAADAREREEPRERRPRPRDVERATSASVKKEIQQALPQAQVASSKDVADTISGSLVDASNLSHDLGLALSIVAAVAAFLLAALLALSSVGKRVRELGTLKALGWTQRMVVRQIAGESLAPGRPRRPLRDRARRRGRARDRRVRAVADRELDDRRQRPRSAWAVSTARTATTPVSLTAPVGITVLAIGFGLALLGGLIAGTAGALRAARLRPADALRQVE